MVNWCLLEVNVNGGSRRVYRFSSKFFLYKIVEIYVYIDAAITQQIQCQIFIWINEKSNWNLHNFHEVNNNKIFPFSAANVGERGWLCGSTTWTGSANVGWVHGAWRKWHSRLHGIRGEFCRKFFLSLICIKK